MAESVPTLERLKKQIDAQSDEYWASADDTGIIVADLLAAIAAEKEQNKKLSANGLGLLGKLIGSSSRNRLMFAAPPYEVQLKIVSFMNEMVSDVGFQANGCFCLMKLALSLDNTVLLASPKVGAIKAISQAMQGHTKSPLVQEMGCRALCNIGVHVDNKSLLVENNAHILVIEAMRTHSTQVNVQNGACAALRALSAESESNQTILLTSQDAFDAVFNAIRNYMDDAQLIEMGFGTLSNLLSTSSSNEVAAQRDLYRIKWIAAPYLAHELALKALQQHAENERVTVAAVWILKRLAGSDIDSNTIDMTKRMLVSSPHLVHEAIIKAARAFPQNKDIAHRAFQTLSLLHDSLRTRTVNVMAREPLVVQELIGNALKNFKESLSILSSACVLVAKLASEEETRNVLISAPYKLHLAFVSILNSTQQQVLVQVVFRAVALLTQDCENMTMLKQLVDPPLLLHEKVISRLKKYEYTTDHAGLAEHALAILCNLSANPDVIPLLEEADIIPWLVQWKAESQKHGDDYGHDSAKFLLQKLNYYSTTSKLTRVLSLMAK